MADEQFEYVALKRMKVQELDAEGQPRLGENGRPIMRECAPGDLIPEATTWKSLWREVRAGRVGLKGTALSGPAIADSMRRQVASTPTPRRKATGSKKGTRKRKAKAKATREARRRRVAMTADESAVARATGMAPEMPAETVSAPE